jgi:hypothetical protein
MSCTTFSSGMVCGVQSQLGSYQSDSLSDLQILSNVTLGMANGEIDRVVSFILYMPPMSPAL